MTDDPSDRTRPSDESHASSEAAALAARLAGVEARLVALERRLGIADAATAPAAQSAADASTPRARPFKASPPAGQLEPSRRHASAASTLDFRWLESAIGGRWYAVAGAIIVTIGVGLALKFAYDQGWMRHVTPSMRCMAIAALGLTLGGLGWRFRPRLGDWAAGGLLASGVGCLYAAGWAAYGLYDLLPDAMAFLILVAVSLAGIMVSAASGLAAIGVLSILGGLFAPVIVGQSQTPPWIMASHLLAVMTVGSVVAAWKRGRFATLRSVAWWGVVLLGTAWAGMVDLWQSHPATALLFPALFWLLVHAGLWAECRDDHADTAGRVARDDDERTDRPTPAAILEAAARPRARAMISSFSTTLWSGWMGAYAASTSGVVEPWVVCLAYAAACWTCSLPMAGTLVLLRDVPRTDRERLGTSLILQVGGLLIATVGFGLGGISQVIAWLGLGLVAVVAGRAIRTTRLDTYGLVLVSIGSARLAYRGLDQLASMARPGVVSPATIELAGLHLGEWSALVLGAGVAWLAASRVTQCWRAAAPNTHALVAAIMGTLALIVAPTIPGSQGLSLATWTTFVALLLLALWPVMGAVTRLPALATFAIAVAAAVWSGATLDRWTQDAWADATLHPGLAIGLFIALASGVVAFVNATRVRDASGPFAAAIAALLGSLVFLAATTFDVARLATIATQDETSRRAAVSIWWAVLSLALLGAGFARQWRWPRYAGLGLMGVAAVKALTYDLAGIGQGWRVISVLGVGLLMLVVAVLYGKLSSRVSDTDDGKTTT